MSDPEKLYKNTYIEAYMQRKLSESEMRVFCSVLDYDYPLSSTLVKLFHVDNLNNELCTSCGAPLKEED